MITEEQRQQRRKHIGSSDISAIMGVNPFMSEYEVWMSKVYELKDYVPNDSAEIGNYLEDDIVDWVAKKYKFSHYKTDPEQLRFVCDKHRLFACNIDGLAYNDDIMAAIEGKYTSQIDEWGYGEETIPDHFMLQVQEQIC